MKSDRRLPVNTEATAPIPPHPGGMKSGWQSFNRPGSPVAVIRAASGTTSAVCPTDERREGTRLDQK